MLLTIFLEDYSIIENRSLTCHSYRIHLQAYTHAQIHMYIIQIRIFFKLKMLSLQEKISLLYFCLGFLFGWLVWLWLRFFFCFNIFFEYHHTWSFLFTVLKLSRSHLLWNVVE